MAQSIEERLSKALKDVDFWRDSYDKLESDHKKLAASLTEQSSELVSVRDAGIQALDLAAKATRERDEAIRHLKMLAYHTAGRDGMQGVSKKFCGICGNGYRCPIGPANDFLDGIVPAESEAAA